MQLELGEGGLIRLRFLMIVRPTFKIATYINFFLVELLIHDTKDTIGGRQYWYCCRPGRMSEPIVFSIET